MLHKVGQLGIQSQPEGCWIGIVGGLGTVDVVVGVAILVIALFMTHDFQGAIGNNLIGVHIGGGTSPTLNGIHRKLVMQLARQQFIARGADGLAYVCRQCAQFRIGKGRSLFYVSQSPYQRWALGNCAARNAEVLHGPHGLHTIIGIGRDFHFAKKIVFYTRFHFLLQGSGHKQTAPQYQNGFCAFPVKVLGVLCK